MGWATSPVVRRDRHFEWPWFKKGRSRNRFISPFTHDSVFSFWSFPAAWMQNEEEEVFLNKTSVWHFLAKYYGPKGSLARLEIVANVHLKVQILKVSGIGMSIFWNEWRFNMIQCFVVVWIVHQTQQLGGSHIFLPCPRLVEPRFLGEAWKRWCGLQNPWARWKSTWWLGSESTNHKNKQLGTWASLFRWFWCEQKLHHQFWTVNWTQLEDAFKRFCHVWCMAFDRSNSFWESWGGRCCRADPPDGTAVELTCFWGRSFGLRKCVRFEEGRTLSVASCARLPVFFGWECTYVKRMTWVLRSNLLSLCSNTKALQQKQWNLRCSPNQH